MTGKNSFSTHVWCKMKMNKLKLCFCKRGNKLNSKLSKSLLINEKFLQWEDTLQTIAQTEVATLATYVIQYCNNANTSIVKSWVFLRNRRRKSYFTWLDCIMVLQCCYRSELLHWSYGLLLMLPGFPISLGDLYTALQSLGQLEIP